MSGPHPDYPVNSREHFDEPEEPSSVKAAFLGILSVSAVLAVLGGVVWVFA